MPRIDPNKLLKGLSVLLSPSGGVKRKDEVQHVASLMTKFSKKIVCKCIYVLILKSTEADLLDMFMSAGGWDLTFNWLSDGIKMKNWPLVAELVELLLLCPVDIVRLKWNNYAKVIKLLSKDPASTDRVRQLACSVVDQWFTIVKAACEASNPPSTGNLVVPEEDRSASQDVENGVEEMSSGETTPRGVFKITIRDGKNVLPEVISSERTGEEVEDKADDEEQEEEEESKEDKMVVEARAVLKDDPVAKESFPPKKLAEGKKQTLKRKSEKKSSPEPEKKAKATPEKKVNVQSDIP